MDLGQILSWVVGAVGLTGFYFAGKKKWWSWYINLGCQILWATYAFVTGQPAFLVTAAVYFVIFAINARKWTKEHLAVKKMLAMEEPNEVPQESNLVLHARRELELIGEEPDVIEWYVRVINAYRSFGHSGGSHMAVMPCLTRLLNFEPLTVLSDAPDEWIRHTPDMWDGKNHVWQNVRDGRAFSSDGGKTFTLLGDESKYLHSSISQEFLYADVQKS